MRQFRALEFGVPLLQASWRAKMICQVRRRMMAAGAAETQRRDFAAIHIQRVARGKFCRRRLDPQWLATVRLQQIWRGGHCRRKLGTLGVMMASSMKRDKS